MNQAHRPEAAPTVTWTLLFAVVLGLLVVWALLSGVLAIGGPAS